MEEQEIANNEENTRKYGRRSTDDPSFKERVPHSGGSVFRWLLNGITVGGVITAIFIGGRASKTLDSNVVIDEKQDIRIERLYAQNNKLLLALTEQNIQQKESDKRFESMFNDANQNLNEIKKGQEEMNDNILRNEKDIIILQQKVSVKDKLSVYELAMR